MKRIIPLLFVIATLGACGTTNFSNDNTYETVSPSGKVALRFELTDGKPYYSLVFNGERVIDRSVLGFEFNNMNPLTSNFELLKFKENSFEENWETVWGERRTVQNNYNELVLNLTESTGDMRKMNLYFRVFDDGLGFRYEIPEQPNLDKIEITNELTEFNFSSDHSIWFQACDTIDDSWENGYNTYERLYQNNKLSGLETLIHTPATLELANGTYASIHEANLTDYASMVLAKGEEVDDLKCDLVPWPDGIKVKTQTPMVTPWRTIQLGERLGDLVESDMILNLNEPNKIEDVSWIEPMKYVGIWWEMHLNKSTWEAGANHGATTNNTKKYIDFAAQNGFGGVLVEGWNTGWEVWITQPNFSFTQPYPDYDLDFLTDYAQQKGVNIISHHETSGDVVAYEKQMEDAFSLLEKEKIRSVKTGYVGYINPKGQNHHGQYMVNHYRKVVETAAKHKVCVVAHEPIKPTGLRRTYPNMLSREAVRGMEYNAWSTGNPPEHTTILPFTVLLGGPLDYTPGIFQTDLDAFRKGNSTHTTLANQLALYVVIYSPVQMAADLPEHYMGNPAFKFIKDVVTDWDETKLLDARIGDYVAMARKARNSDDWFVGAVTDEEPRELEVELDFLDSNKKYVAEVYADAETADYRTNPMAVKIDSFLVDQKSKVRMKLAAGGGQAVRLRAAESTDLNGLTYSSF